MHGSVWISVHWCRCGGTILWNRPPAHSLVSLYFVWDTKNNSWRIYWRACSSSSFPPHRRHLSKVCQTDYDNNGISQTGPIFAAKLIFRLPYFLFFFFFADVCLFVCLRKTWAFFGVGSLSVFKANRQTTTKLIWWWRWCWAWWSEGVGKSILEYDVMRSGNRFVCVWCIIIIPHSSSRLLAVEGGSTIAHMQSIVSI